MVARSICRVYVKIHVERLESGWKRLEGLNNSDRYALLLLRLIKRKIRGIVSIIGDIALALFSPSIAERRSRTLSNSR